MLFEGTSQASRIYGSIWENATYESMNPDLGAPGGAATSTFYVDIADQIDFQAPAPGPWTYNQFLNNPTWTGTDIGGNNMDTYSGHGTFFQFTGNMSLVNGQVFYVTHDDGFWLQIGNTAFDDSDPVYIETTELKWTGATGVYAFTLNYGAYNNYPEVLTTRGATFVPEPTSLLLLGLGLVGLAGMKRKLKK